MQSTVQSEQWSWMLTQLWSWMWSGMSWILDLQRIVFGFMFDGTFGMAVLKSALLLLPAAVLLVSMWAMMVSLYSIPFRSGRGYFLTALLMSWWDVGRMVWFYWAGIARFLFVLVGWIGSGIRAFLRLLWNTIKGALNSPLALLDWTSRSYFKPGVPWLAFLLLLLWSAIEAVIFTFTLRPTMNELLADLTGFEPNPIALSVLLYLFLFFLVGGSFACVQALNDAIKSRQYGTIISMTLIELVVAMFEVLFLYRELVDAITPWMAQQGFNLGLVGTLAVAFGGWVGVRGMTWFLFGRYGTPALIAVLARETLSHGGSVDIAPPKQPDWWRAPITALKAEVEWFKTEAREMFELLTLPVLQLLAAGFNFWLVVLLGRPHFTLPFRSLEDVQAATPFSIERKAGARGPATQGVA
ncbi:MAG TPA: hypothetical protein VHH32_02765 [Gemmatimonadales bacterium]|jgi:hypothetical protein|nr:hypothetical protein [Gemmatimonadales bacterium]